MRALIRIVVTLAIASLGAIEAPAAIFWPVLHFPVIDETKIGEMRRLENIQIFNPSIDVESQRAGVARNVLPLATRHFFSVSDYRMLNARGDVNNTRLQIAASQSASFLRSFRLRDDSFRPAFGLPSDGRPAVAENNSWLWRLLVIDIVDVTGPREDIGPLAYDQSVLGNVSRVFCSSSGFLKGVVTLVQNVCLVKNSARGGDHEDKGGNLNPFATGISAALLFAIGLRFLYQGRFKSDDSLARGVAYLMVAWATIFFGTWISFTALLDWLGH